MILAFKYCFALCLLVLVANVNADRKGVDDNTLTSKDLNTSRIYAKHQHPLHHAIRNRTRYHPIQRPIHLATSQRPSNSNAMLTNNQIVISTIPTDNSPLNATQNIKSQEKRTSKMFVHCHCNPQRRRGRGKHPWKALFGKRKHLFLTKCNSCKAAKLCSHDQQFIIPKTVGKLNTNARISTINHRGHSKKRFNVRRHSSALTPLVKSKESMTPQNSSYNIIDGNNTDLTKSSHYDTLEATKMGNITNILTLLANKTEHIMENCTNKYGNHSASMNDSMKKNVTNMSTVRPHKHTYIVKNCTKNRRSNSASMNDSMKNNLTNILTARPHKHRLIARNCTRDHGVKSASTNDSMKNNVTNILTVPPRKHILIARNCTRDHGVKSASMNDSMQNNVTHILTVPPRKHILIARNCTRDRGANSTSMNDSMKNNVTNILAVLPRKHTYIVKNGTQKAQTHFESKFVPTQKYITTWANKSKHIIVHETQKHAHFESKFVQKMMNLAYILNVLSNKSKHVKQHDPKMHHTSFESNFGPIKKNQRNTSTVLDATDNSGSMKQQAYFEFESGLIAKIGNRYIVGVNGQAPKTHMNASIRPTAIQKLKSAGKPEMEIIPSRNETLPGTKQQVSTISPLRVNSSRHLSGSVASRGLPPSTPNTVEANHTVQGRYVTIKEAVYSVVSSQLFSTGLAWFLLVILVSIDYLYGHNKYVSLVIYSGVLVLYVMIIFIVMGVRNTKLA